MSSPVERFFTVWCPQSSKPVTRKFATLGQAIHVRDAIKKREPDRDFHVMVSVPEDIISSVAAQHVEDTETH